MLARIVSRAAFVDQAKARDLVANANVDGVHAA
jgi:hypothetical protein